MKVGMIGAGAIGFSLAKLLIDAGHEVALSNSRGPETLKEKASVLGSKAHAMTVGEAAAFGEIVVLAVPYRDPSALPPVDTVRGKIVVDAMNPYRNDGSVEDLRPSTSSEETQKRLPGARIVKAFNTIWSEHLAKNGKTDAPMAERHAIPIAGDDAEGLRIVSRLIEEIGFAPVVSGSLREGGFKQQPNAPLYNKPMTPAEMEKLARA